MLKTWIHWTYSPCLLSFATLNRFLYGHQLTRDVIPFNVEYSLFHSEDIRTFIYKKILQSFRITVYQFIELLHLSAGNQSYYGNFEKSVEE